MTLNRMNIASLNKEVNKLKKHRMILLTIILFLIILLVQGCCEICPVPGMEGVTVQAVKDPPTPEPVEQEFHNGGDSSVSLYMEDGSIIYVQPGQTMMIPNKSFTINFGD